MTEISGAGAHDDTPTKRYAKAVTAAVVLILAVWHFGYDVLIMARGWDAYDPRAVAAGAWLALTAVQLTGSVLLLRARLTAHTARALAAAAVVAGTVATATYPTGGAISDVSWAWNTVGWLGVLLLMHRPWWELIALLAVNTAVTVVFLAVDGALDRVMTARLLTTAYTTAGIQAIFGFLAQQLDRAAVEAECAATAQVEQLAQLKADETVHAERRRRYKYLRRRVEPLLRGLSERELDPASPTVRQIAAIEAARLRRLFAETDDTPHPLLHELRACADIAERRKVRVTLLAYGDLPELPTSVRRELTEVPLLVLTSAVSHARLTVLAASDEVLVSVVADAPAGALDGFTRPSTATVHHSQEEDQLWVEIRWTPRVPVQSRTASRSESSTTTRSSSKASKPG